ncbi:MAG: cytochrome b/b6 domain-containing protein [Chloroflexi bacterium]|nr:cytochrome b/b6 domain-containing protein [Chloroflexota bacterium]
MSTPQRLIPRYRLMQRISHWTFTIAFLVLLLSGLGLFVPVVNVWTANTTGRLAHRVAAVVLIATPLFYLLTDRRGLMQLLKDSVTYDQDDREWFKHFVPYVFGNAKGLPPQGRINAGEKLHHVAIILGFIVISITGLLLWFWQDIPANVRLVTLMIHDAAMLELTVLTLGHVFFVFVYGALAGMWGGSVTQAYARMEHPKWLAQIVAEGKVDASKG